MENDVLSSPLIVSAGVVALKGRVLLCRRRAEAHNGLKWEFPGGKLEAGETPEEALRRELSEELGIWVEVGRILDAVYYRYPDRCVLLLFYRCALKAGEPQPIDCDTFAWVEPEALPGYDFAGADAEFLRRNNFLMRNA